MCFALPLALNVRKQKRFQMGINRFENAIKSGNIWKRTNSYRFSGDSQKRGLSKVMTLGDVITSSTSFLSLPSKIQNKYNG